MFYSIYIKHHRGHISAKYAHIQTTAFYISFIITPFSTSLSLLLNCADNSTKIFLCIRTGNTKILLYRRTTTKNSLIISQNNFQNMKCHVYMSVCVFVSRNDEKITFVQLNEGLLLTWMSPTRHRNMQNTWNLCVPPFIRDCFSGKVPEGKKWFLRWWITIYFITYTSEEQLGWHKMIENEWKTWH